MSIPILLLLLAGCDRGFADPSRELAAPIEAAPLHPVTIHQPTTLGVVDTSILDVNGTPVGVACETCHGPAADPIVVPGDNPEDFHASVTVTHGEQPCFACHDREDRSRLKLADGKTLAMAEAMDLCAQCHGPQLRDYRAGSHGGMTGYWDLRQGPRERNHCIDCHSAHQPACQGGMPVPAPNDRGTNLDRGDH
jgi:hypothetical protein